jgi:hypothetical protein
MKHFVLMALFALLLPGFTLAAEPAAVEVWVCYYREGQTLGDLEDWYDDFNTLSDEMDNPNFEAWIWTPFFADLEMADVLVVTSFPDLESMGQSMMEFFGGAETGALFERYQSIVDCKGRDLWMVQQMRARD